MGHASLGINGGELGEPLLTPRPDFTAVRGTPSSRCGARCARSAV